MEKYLNQYVGKWLKKKSGVVFHNTFPKALAPVVYCSGYRNDNINALLIEKPFQPYVLQSTDPKKNNLIILSDGEANIARHDFNYLKKIWPTEYSGDETDRVCHNKDGSPIMIGSYINIKQRGRFFKHINVQYV